jgi:hypothetical protein
MIAAGEGGRSLDEIGPVLANLFRAGPAVAE